MLSPPITEAPTFWLTEYLSSQCKPNGAYTYSSDGSQITGYTLTANGNACSAPIPVTFPGQASTTTGGTTKEQIGKDPLTIWATLSGSPVSFTLSSPVAV
jgi:hypothetical protein